MRLLFRIVFAVLAAVVLVIGGLLLLPGEKIAMLAADQIEAQTGRRLSFEGDVSISLWPALGVRTGPVALSNADWAGPEPMLKAQDLSIGVAAADLIRGKVRVQKISALAPQLNLSTGADGRGNWVFDAPEPTSGVSQTPGQSGGSVPLVVESLSLKQARLTYAPHGQAPITIADMDLDLAWPQPDGAATVQLVLRPVGEPIDVVAEIDGFGAFLGGQVALIGATFQGPGGRARFDGRASIAGDLAGRLTLASEDSRQLLKAAGLGAGRIPDGFGRRLTLGTDLTYTTDGRVALRDLAVDLDGNSLTGAADIVFRDVPHVTAQLQAGALDFSGLKRGSGSGAVSSLQGQAGWSRAPIDASVLGLVDGKVDLSFQSLNTGQVVLGASAMNLALDRSRAVLTLGSVPVFDGIVQGQLVANNRSGLSVGGNLTATGIETRLLLRDLAGNERFSGKGQANLQFLGVGNSLDAIMRSLSGSGRLEVGRGRILGFDLEALMRSGSGNGGTTVFDSLTASYTITGGNLDNQDLLMRLRNFRADGKGRIGLGARDLDYLFTPVALRANSGEGLAIPVRIRGPWANPAILPDLSAVVQQRLDLEADKIEDQAKDQLRQKLQEELDASVIEDQDAEEVLKDRLEDEAKKGFLKLLGVD